jgi:hypothetical protein
MLILFYNAVVNAVVEASGANAPSSSEIAF